MGAYETPDGRGGSRRSRASGNSSTGLSTATNILDGLVIAVVERRLAEADVDMADLSDAALGDPDAGAA